MTVKVWEIWKRIKQSNHYAKFTLNTSTLLDPSKTGKFKYTSGFWSEKCHLGFEKKREKIVRLEERRIATQGKKTLSYVKHGFLEYTVLQASCWSEFLTVIFFVFILFLLFIALFCLTLLLIFCTGVFWLKQNSHLIKYIWCLKFEGRMHHLIQEINCVLTYF